MFSEEEGAKSALKELIKTLHQSLPMLINAAVSVSAGYGIGKAFLEEPIVSEAAKEFGLDEDSEILIPVRYFAQLLGMLPAAYSISLLHNLIPNSIKSKIVSNQSSLNPFSNKENRTILEKLIRNSDEITSNPQLAYNLTKATFASASMLTKLGAFAILSTFTAAGMTLASEDFLQNFLEMDMDETNQTVKKITYAGGPIFLLFLVMGTHAFIQSSVNEFKPHALATLSYCSSIFTKKQESLDYGQDDEQQGLLEMDDRSNNRSCTIL